jgi:hypothetical protein
MGHLYGPAPSPPDHASVVAPPRRMARAGVSAAAAVALGLAGHVLAGGAPTVSGVGLAFLAVLVPSWLLAGRERSWTAIAGVQIAAQQVVHPLLVLTSAMPASDAVPHDLMFFLHVLGACVMAVWLRLGERRLWAAARRLAARLVRWISRLLGVPLAPATPASSGPVGYVPPAAPVVLRHSLRRRGPPLPA